MGDPLKGRSYTILLEKFPGIDFGKLTLFLNGMAATMSQPHPKGKVLEKSAVKLLLSIAQSDRERECIRVAIYKASGISPTEARHRYRFQNMEARASAVDKAIQEAQIITEAIDDLAKVQDKAILATFGVEPATETDSSESEGEEDMPMCLPAESTEKENQIALDDLAHLMQQSIYNWFEFYEKVEALTENDTEVSAITESFFSNLSKFKFSEVEVGQINQSRQAFFAAQSESNSHQLDQIARAVNRDIVSESDSDVDPQDLVGITDPLSSAAKALVIKRRVAIQRKARRLKAKAIAQRRFLSRKVSKRTSNILANCPHIGERIEEYVQEHSVGADAWRRTGVLTFDGNVKLKEKVTYEGIRQHLQNVHHRHFSYGTIVELCVARNKRRRSAQRYHGIAKVTTRRARKGFNLRFNPDKHWSAAFYKGLNKLQYADGRDMVNINWDDATGFHLDTLTTCKQYPSAAVQGKDVLTTRTDYVNKYASVLQTTSYNFTKTQTTPELCAGIVKAQKLHEKNPAQHASDLEMLEEKQEVQAALKHQLTGQAKAIDCIRVDGAVDEGPAHHEVQFWWTLRHLRRRKVCTLLTSRSSGSSYLNRVELQNGSLSHGHANTFIPSTLTGACTDEQTGKVDESKWKRNMELAIQAYINRVNHCPCGDTVIHLFQGANSEELQSVREKLQIFLKGSQKMKHNLQDEFPDLYAWFDSIWTVRNRHMVPGLPSQYIFLLICCYKENCTHPLCKEGKPNSVHTWYPGGPPLCYLPLPRPDLDRLWGNPSCPTCKGFCAGHYKCSVFTNTTDSVALNATSPPPSNVLKDKFNELHGRPITDEFVQSAAKEVLLTQEEVSIWLDHLNTILRN